MSRRAITSVLGAAVLLVASVVGASSASAVASDATAPDLSFGDVTLYGTVQHDVVATASGGPVTFGALPTVAAVGGAQDQADDYSVVSRTCAGTIAVDSSCTVRIAFNPLAPGAAPGHAEHRDDGPGHHPARRAEWHRGTQRHGHLLRAHDADAVPGHPFQRRSTAPGGVDDPRADHHPRRHPTTGVSAVVFNLTAVATTRSGYFTTFPSGKPRPTTSSINFPSGWTGANMVTLPRVPTAGSTCSTRAGRRTR